MASIIYFEPRSTYRVFYRLKVNGALVEKAKYAKQKNKALQLKREIESLESATRTGIVTTREIELWVQRGWLKQEEADGAFPGFKESSTRKRRSTVEGTDYGAILDAYEEYALSRSKGGEERKSHKNHMSMAKQVVTWLHASFPDLSKLTTKAVEDHVQELKTRYTAWTVYHHITKLRLLLDRAVEMEMIHENPARAIKMGQPKKSKTRRILDEEEARHLLQVSMKYRDSTLISGCLPTIVRLGLYAGLRNEEMCWLTWDAIDFKRRIISIEETRCEESGEIWRPKDFESRRIDVKEDCIAHLKEEKARLKKTSPFVLPSRRLLGSVSFNVPKYEYRARPLTQEVPQKAFSKMIRAEELDTGITVYSLRHTFATMALRAGVDLRTLQQRMGHSDIKTTMEYLHFIEPEEHPLDKLPY